MNDSGQSTFNQARIEWAIRLRFSPMPTLDMKYITANLNAFRIGELRTVGKLWEVMMERDGELATNADKRASDLAALDWEVVSDGSKDGDLHAQALKYFYDHLKATAALDQDTVGGVPLLLKQMGSAHSYYYSAHEMLMRVDNPAAREITAEFRHTPVWFFESRRGYLACLQHIFDMYGQPCLQGEWLTCVGLGWMRHLSNVFALKMFSLRDFALFNARSATGVLEGTTSAGKGDTSWDEAKEAMDSIANDSAVLHSQGLELKFLEQAANRGSQAFMPLIEYIDRLYAKCFRGMDMATSSRAPQKGTSPDGGKATGASVQGEESGIYLDWDAVWASGILNERVDRPVIACLFNQEPRAWITVKPPLDDTAAEDLAAIQGLVPMGLRISLKEAYKRFRWSAPADGDPCLSAPAIPPSGATPVTPAALPLPGGERRGAGGIAPSPSPIAAGARIAPIQTAGPRLPDPQVDTAGFWSNVGKQAGQAMQRARDFYSAAVNALPALAYAIPNAAAPKAGCSPAEPQRTAEKNKT